MLDAETGTPDTPEPTDNGSQSTGSSAEAETPAKPAKKAAAKKTTAKKAATKKTAAAEPPAAEAPTDAEAAAAPKKKAAKKTAAKKTAAKKTAAEAPEQAGAGEKPAKKTTKKAAAADGGAAAPMVLFQAPEATAPRPAKKTAKKKAAAPEETAGEPAAAPATAAEAEGAAEEAPARAQGGRRRGGRAAQKDETDAPAEAAEGGEDDAQDSDADSESGEGGGARRRRRRGGRRRRRGGSGEGGEDADSSEEESEDSDDDSGSDGEGTSRRRRTRARRERNPEDEITGVSGSTRLEAKKQRRREGREAGRRRAPIVSEAEFLARREAVDRVMVIRQREDLTQIAVLEDKVLVEHYVARESQTSLIGNIYLGRVQNVLPSMEAAFIDIGKGRNAVLYAGEVNWSALGHPDGQQRKIESVLKSGQTVLVQVTKDPIGHKGARLTGQISLPGRFLVYVPDGNTSGISRKLPDTERNRLKNLLKEIVPDSAGVIVRTAAEGASEEELTRDVQRLTALWSDIESRVKAGKAPELLYGEPDLTLKVVRDLFTEDFGRLVVEGSDAWDLVDGYVSHVAPDLRDRLERFEPATEGKDAGKDVFAAYRVDEQIAKGLDRKVWLPSGGSLIIDRTEAMTVVDVNTGKFTGSGGNLEETVTKNNLEAAEEIVRQLRLRDIGGIIVVDFIDMVLESNRDLVLRRLVECLGRDRTRHQVAEVTSLGLVQMTRKRIGTGLLEAFSNDCEHCKGRGVVVHDHPVESGGKSGGDEPRSSRRSRGGKGRGRGGSDSSGSANSSSGQSGGEGSRPSPMALAGSRPHSDDELIVRPDELDGETVEGAESVESADTAAAPDAEAATATAAAPDAESGAKAEPAVRVVSSRRRRAGRPAGPPVAVEDAAAEAGGEATPAGPSEPESAAEVAAEPAGPAGTDPESDGVPDGAPDAGEDAGPDPDQDAGGDPEQDGGEDADAASLTHVPVKRKGSRKR